VIRAVLLGAAALLLAQASSAQEPQQNALQWVERPTSGDVIRYYPREALEEGVSGVVTLTCIVIADGRINCAVVSESPAGHGFGDAALALSTKFRLPQTMPNGSSTEGGTVTVTVPFNLR
jgi:protein TonB